MSLGIGKITFYELSCHYYNIRKLYVYCKVIKHYIYDITSYVMKNYTQKNYTIIYGTQAKIETKDDFCY